MSASVDTPSASRELVLSRIINAPRAKVYKAWTDPELLRQWFAPLPWKTPRAELDVRPGGSNLVVMAGPDGNEFPNRGVYLEVVENERLVFTDAYRRVGALGKALHDRDPDVRGDAGKDPVHRRVRHWSVADRETHEKMGFHAGWGKCADQLEALVAKL